MYYAYELYPIKYDNDSLSKKKKKKIKYDNDSTIFPKNLSFYLENLLLLFGLLLSVAFIAF